MGVFLTYRHDSRSGSAADTGNLVHSAVHAFHTTKDVEAGRAALELARTKFPLGNTEKAQKIFAAYAADKENAEAEVVWCEKEVRLDLPPASYDPTGQPVVIIGTLDQVRRHRDGTLRVWDVKTGDRLDSSQIVDEHLMQQAAYVLAARQSLNPEVQAGGLIYTPGYEKPRGRRHLPFKKLTPERCRLLMATVVHHAAMVRSGHPAVRPSAESCAYCPAKPFDNCVSMFDSLYSR